MEVSFKDRNTLNSHIQIGVRRRADSAYELPESKCPKLLSSIASATKKCSMATLTPKITLAINAGLFPNYASEAVFTEGEETMQEMPILKKATLAQHGPTSEIRTEQGEPSPVKGAFPTFYTAGFFSKDYHEVLHLDAIFPARKKLVIRQPSYSGDFTSGIALSP